ncbi:MAG: SDR family oxidoreductase [Candidatus Mycalebacterium zealandia]|nr:MAG: SDR family oxidoreductase [Candidatus Mycalebacterium zealandia]
MAKDTQKKWAIILGASSGFGQAAAVELAKNGMNICGVHLDRKAGLGNVEKIKSAIESEGAKALFFNVNAADPEKRAEVLDSLAGPAGAESPVKVLLHSLAFGTLKHYVSDKPEEMLTNKNMDMTLDVMAHSLVYWSQDVVTRKLMGEGGRIFAMTSSGSHRVWPTYGAVSAAKAALEHHIRQLAVELAPKKITANSIRAGVTDTPALRKIPGNEALVENAMRVNPSGRLTTTEDVAKTIALLAQSGADWVTGNVIGVDGGEDLI